MTIGTVLLQPQSVRRFEAVAQPPLADDAFAVVQQLLLKPDLLEQLAAELSPVLLQVGQQLLSQIENNFDRGREELAELLQPSIGYLNGLVSDAGELENFGDVLDLVLSMVDRLAEGVASLSINDIRSFVERVIDILANTFGLTSDWLISVLREIVGNVVLTLEQTPQGVDIETQTARQELAALLRRIQREVLTDLPAVNINAESISREIMRTLRRNGLETWVEKAACLAEKARAIVGASTSLVEIAGVGGGAAGADLVDPISTGSRYCWYASWLYAFKTRNFGGQLADFIVPLYPTDEVWVSDDGKQLILRRVGEDKDVVLYQSDSEIDWYDAPQFQPSGGNPEERFTFTGALSPQFLETWTQVTHTLVHVSRSVSHFVNFAVEPNNFGANIPLWLWGFTRAIGDPSVGAPFTSWLRDKFGWGVGQKVWLDIIGNWFPVIFGSIEGRHSQTHAGAQFLYWITLLGDDALDAFTFHIVPTMVHEGFLSIFTLINYDGPTTAPFNDEGRPLNREYVYPIVNGCVLLGNWILVKCVVPREDYSYPFQPDNVGTYMKWLFGVAPFFGMAAGIVGEFIGWTLSRSVSARTLLIQAGLGAFKGWGTFIVAHYYFVEGDTDDGKYNPTGDAFSGYPDAETSPYKLPYEKGKALFMGQGNQGFFSHFRRFDPSGPVPQIYAYDFAHDFGEEVLAVRDGTVVDYFDWIVDDIQPDASQQTDAQNLANGSGMLVGGQSTIDSWNFVLVRHDDPFGTETADEKAHDRDINGNTNVTTYCIYGHGAQNGVRDAFALHQPAVNPGSIIGTRVKQGQPVMLAGDVGVSFHNHLHIHVLVDPAKAMDGNTTVSRGSLNQDRTIPFVYRDVKHIIRADGRALRLTWYTSDNERRTS